jgi:hypothetical protein
MFLQHGRSYIWLFPIFLGLFVGGIVVGATFGSRDWGAVVMPIFMAFILIE